MARPTHNLVAKRKGTDGRGRTIGVGWIDEKGWIGITLNPCVVISHADDVYLNLYPARYDDDPPASQEGEDETPF